MKTSTYSKTIFVLGLLGLLFSGYLSAIKLFTSTCAFNEPCPYFLGYPACWFGFVIFLIIFSSATFGLLKNIYEKTVAKIILTLSALGILFAGHFVIPEIGNIISGYHKTYTLGLPTCTYGLIFYIIIFTLSIWYLNTN